MTRPSGELVLRITDTELTARLRTFICKELLHRPSYPLEDDEPLVTGGLIDSFALARIALFTETTSA